MIEGYYIGLISTAAYMFLICRPRLPGDWMAFTALTICWPLMAAFAAYHVIRNALKPE